MILQQISRHTSREDVDWMQHSPLYDVFELGITINSPPGRSPTLDEHRDLAICPRCNVVRECRQSPTYYGYACTKCGHFFDAVREWPMQRLNTDK